MATDSVTGDNAIYLQVTEGAHKLKVRIEELLEKNASLEKNKDRLKDEFKRLKTANKEAEEELLRNANSRLKAFQENQMLSEKCSEMEKVLSTTLEKNQNLEKDLEKTNSSLKQKLENCEKRCSKAESNNQRLTNDVKKERKDKEEAMSKCTQIDQKRKDTEATLKLSQDAYSKLQKEKRSCQLDFMKQLRVSLRNMPDAKPSTGNPNIAEMFSELYDNEWTNTIEQFKEKKDSEEHAVEYMLDILQFAFTLCNEITTSMENSSKTKCSAMSLSDGKNQLEMSSTFQHEDNRENISKECSKGTGDSVPGRQFDSKEAHEQALGSDSVSDNSLVGGNVFGDTNCDIDSVPGRIRSLTDAIVKGLTKEYQKGLRKMQKELGMNMTVLVQQDVTEVISKRFEVSTEIDDDLTKYIKKCIELCWYMGLQNVYIKFEKPCDGVKFDSNIYKPYTKPGKHIAYVVWPPLFLLQDGSMLSKGVAQAKP